MNPLRVFQPIEVERQRVLISNSNGPVQANRVWSTLQLACIWDLNVHYSFQVASEQKPAHGLFKT